MERSKVASWDALIFDLDDTLIQTSTYILPRAFVELSSFIAEQYSVHLNAFEIEERKRSSTSLERSSLFFNDLALYVKSFIKDDDISPDELTSEMQKIFYERTVSEKEVILYPGVDLFLEDVSRSTSIFLVTAGHHPTQHKKIELSGLKDYFDEIHVIDYKGKETKGDAFNLILAHHNFRPEHVLVVGDRLASEIYQASKLGLTTAWLKSGEHTQERMDAVTPDFTYESIVELIEGWSI
jgi:FMN phosphatase YigB (HAD superfamily)